MIENLISLTNTEEFYQNGHFRLVNLKGEIKTHSTMEFNFRVEEGNNEGKIYNVQDWTLIAQNTIDFRGIYADFYLPYIKLKILTDHPLLWSYNQAILECELIKFPENPSGFMGDLFFEYEKVAGNWIPLHKHFYALNDITNKMENALCLHPNL